MTSLSCDSTILGKPTGSRFVSRSYHKDFSRVGIIIFFIMVVLRMPQDLDNFLSLCARSCRYFGDLADAVYIISKTRPFTSLEVFDDPHYDKRGVMV